MESKKMSMKHTNKPTEMLYFTCKLYRPPARNCRFRVRWNQQSGQVWEAGAHNHGPVAFKENRARPKREWHYLAKAHSYLAIQRKYLVQKCVTHRNNTWFQCRKKRQLKCPYAMRWNKQPGELFESDVHNHANLHTSRIRFNGKWHLLNGKSANSLDEICRQYSLKRIGHGSQTLWCAKCEGHKCYFRLRCVDGKVLWNKKNLCQRAKSETGSKDINENGIGGGEEQSNVQSLQQYREDDQKSTPISEVQIVEPIAISSRDHKYPLPAQMKLEETTAAGRQLRNGNRMQISIDDEGEEQTQQQLPKQHLKRTVKKEEPKEVEGELLEDERGGKRTEGSCFCSSSSQNVTPRAEAVAAAVGEAKGRKEAATAQASTKMLLRERNRPPNYAGLDGNGKKKARRNKQMMI